MSPFKQKVIEAVKMVPYGKVASYGQIALMVGIPRAAIQVGGTLNKLEGEVKLPWWRIVNNAGRISIKGPRHTPQMQRELLKKEGVVVNDKFEFDIEKYRYRPTPDELQNLELKEEYIGKIVTKYLL